VNEAALNEVELDQLQGRGDRIARKLLVPLSVVLVGVMLLFYIVFTVSTVVGESMEPNLLGGDKLFLTKGYRDPARGDIVVFKAHDQMNRPEDLVKRVIAIGGDTVEVRGDTAWVNGVQEPDYGVVRATADVVRIAPLTIPAGAVYVMGDNRPIALDSRDIGPVPLGSVIGRVVYRWAPVNRMGVPR
jgi:signal peptidase I